jgi:2-dehydro-3-deoxy-D-gluconate 5-dehydrogenase
LGVLDQFRLDGRVAVVTGGTRGLGLAMAIGLAEAGADIAVISRRGDDSGLRSQLDTLGRRCCSLTADLADPAARSGLMDRVVAELGQVDILVNNAGITSRHRPEDYPLDEFRSIQEVHLHAAFELSQQAARHMLPRGRGKVINIGSVMSFEGGYRIPAYAAAKHAIAGLTKSLANAWAAEGINVNCIAPGYMETEMSGSLQDDPVRGPQILDRIPAGRWGQPAELAGTVVFLASAASNYLHGAVIPVDGGWLSR